MRAVVRLPTSYPQNLVCATLGPLASLKQKALRAYVQVQKIPFIKNDLEPDPLEANYYVLLCAGRYAATLRKLRLAPTIDEGLRQQRLLHHLYEAAIVEADLERSRRLRRLSPEIQTLMLQRDRSHEENSIGKAEAGLIQHLNSVPRVALIDELTSDDMVNFADMYDGWAQDPRVELFEKLSSGLG